MKGKTKTQKGITLIALIITIVVLLILAAVAINSITNENILGYATNAATDYNKAVANESQMLQNYVDYLNKYSDKYNGGSTTQITWTQTSEGELAVGSAVKTSTNEEFYVFEIDGETVKLLAKNNLKADGSAQYSTESSSNPCAFSTLSGLSFTSGEDLNKNSTVKADPTSAVYKAIKYGESLGATGRLMLYSEAEALESANPDILYGKNGKSSGTHLNYWLGSANNANYANYVWQVNGLNGYLSQYAYSSDTFCGVRPVIEISKSNIS